MRTVVKKSSVKQGRNTITIVQAQDAERGIETREISIGNRGRTNKVVIEIDMATGKLLPSKYTLGGNRALDDEFQAALLKFADLAVQQTEAAQDTA